MFEDAWAAAMPVPHRQDEQDVGARLLTLLAAGLKDELGAQTRFQLGAAAERRSLLGRDRR